MVDKTTIQISKDIAHRLRIESTILRMTIDEYIKYLFYQQPKKVNKDIVDAFKQARKTRVPRKAKKVQEKSKKKDKVDHLEQHLAKVHEKLRK